MRVSVASSCKRAIFICLIADTSASSKIAMGSWHFIVLTGNYYKRLKLKNRKVKNTKPISWFIFPRRELLYIYLITL
jgi:hypothetical protein